MVREDQCVRHDDVLPPPRRKHHNLRNIVTSQGLHALIDLVRLRLITPKPHDTEFRLDLPRVNFNNPDTTRNKLLAQSVSERAHSRLGSAVNAASRVRLTTRNRANVYNVAATAVGAGEEDGEDGLRHGDQTCDVGLEHGVDVCLGDGGGFVHAFDEAAGI